MIYRKKQKSAKICTKKQQPTYSKKYGMLGEASDETLQTGPTSFEEIVGRMVLRRLPDLQNRILRNNLQSISLIPECFN